MEIKSRVSFIREFPAGCGPYALKNENSTPSSSSLRGLQSYIREFPSACGPNAPKPPLGSGRVWGGSDVRNLNPSSSRPSVGMGARFMVKDPPKVKFVDMVDGRGSRSVEGEKRVLGGNSRSCEGVSRDRQKVVGMLELYRKRCEELLKKGGVKRVDLVASQELSREGKIVKQPSLMIGAIPGVEVGDYFYYRTEIVIVGLQRLLIGGIDCLEYNGEKYATCVIANERHSDRMSDPDVLVYVGEGGTMKRNEIGVPPDQPLTGGNLALNNSRKRQKPVRVIRGLGYGPGNAKVLYVYDGLYEVVDTVKKKGPQGNMIFEFHMTRNPGQPAVQWREYRRKFV